MSGKLRSHMTGSLKVKILYLQHFCDTKENTVSSSRNLVIVLNRIFYYIPEQQKQIQYYFSFYSQVKQQVKYCVTYEDMVLLWVPTFLVSFPPV